MKSRYWFGGVVGLLLVGYLWQAARDLRPFVSVSPLGMDGCRVLHADGLIGAEDLEFDHTKGTLYVAASNRRPSEGSRQAFRPDPGAIFRLTSEADALPQKMPIEGLFEPLRPHGMSLYLHPNGTRHLFVVHHSLRGERVVLFRIEATQGEEKLVFLREVSAPQFVSLNDVAGAGLESFYVTNDHGRPGRTGHLVEDFARLSNASLVYFDGTWVQTVAQGLKYANGVQVSADRQHVLVAETLAYRIKIFRRAQDGKLTLFSEKSLDTTPDNFSQDEQGSFLLGAHPSPYLFLRHATKATEKAPSEVLKFRVTPEGSATDFSTVLRDPGNVFSASSVAASHGHRLVVGGVFDPGVLVCDKTNL